MLGFICDISTIIEMNLKCEKENNQSKFILKNIKYLEALNQLLYLIIILFDILLLKHAEIF